MSKNIQPFALLGQLHHPKCSFNIAFNGLVQTCVEIDASRTVYDYIAIFCQLPMIFLTKAQSIFMEIALTNLYQQYIGLIFDSMKSSNRF